MLLQMELLIRREFYKNFSQNQVSFSACGEFALTFRGIKNDTQCEDCTVVVATGYDPSIDLVSALREYVNATDNVKQGFGQ